MNVSLFQGHVIDLPHAQIHLDLIHANVSPSFLEMAVNLVSVARDTFGMDSMTASMKMSVLMANMVAIRWHLALILLDLTSVHAKLDT